MVLIISHLALCHLQNVLIIWHFKICITSLFFNIIVWYSQIIHTLRKFVCCHWQCWAMQQHNIMYYRSRSGFYQNLVVFSWFFDAVERQHHWQFSIHVASSRHTLQYCLTIWRKRKHVINMQRDVNVPHLFVKTLHICQGVQKATGRQSGCLKCNIVLS
jgi:hypothetical protein